MFKIEKIIKRRKEIKRMLCKYVMKNGNECAKKANYVDSNGYRRCGIHKKCKEQIPEEVPGYKYEEYKPEDIKNLIELNSKYADQAKFDDEKYEKITKDIEDKEERKRLEQMRKENEYVNKGNIIMYIRRGFDHGGYCSGAEGDKIEDYIYLEEREKRIIILG